MLQERLELQRQAEAEFAAERALVDEVVARIQQEDRMELAARRAKQADTKVIIMAHYGGKDFLLAAPCAIVGHFTSPRGSPACCCMECRSTPSVSALLDAHATLPCPCMSSRVLPCPAMSHRRPK